MTLWLWVTIVVMMLLLGIGLVFQVLRWKNNDAVRGRILIEMLTKHGNSQEFLAPITSGKVRVPRPDGKGHVEYYTTKLGTWDTKYPTGSPGLIQAPVKKCILKEDELEPSYQRSSVNGSLTAEQLDEISHAIVMLLSSPKITPAILANWEDEKFTQLAVTYSKQKEELINKMASMINPTIVYILLGVAVAGIAVCGFLEFQNYTAMEAMRAALGV